MNKIVASDEIYKLPFWYYSPKCNLGNKYLFPSDVVSNDVLITLIVVDPS